MRACITHQKKIYNVNVLFKNEVGMPNPFHCGGTTRIIVGHLVAGLIEVWSNPHYAPPIAQEGVVGHTIDRCIDNAWNVIIKTLLLSVLYKCRGRHRA